LPNGVLGTWMKTCAPPYDAVNVVIMQKCLSIWGGFMAWNWCSIWNLQNLIDLGPREWRLSCKVSYWVCHRSRRNLNLHMWYVRRKNTRIFTIFYRIMMLQLSLQLKRQYCKYNFPFKHSSGPYLQNIHHNNVPVNVGKREFGIQRRHTGVGKEWSDTIDKSGVIVSIQALGYTKIANRWVMNTHSHCDCAHIF